MLRARVTEAGLSALTASGIGLLAFPTLSALQLFAYDARMDERTAAAAPGESAAAAETTHGGSIKDTIESILVAFILAFIFRAFVVEAFVIPTGSMAPTLLGAHMRFTCKDCGYRYDVNYGVSGEELNIPSEAREPMYRRLNDRQRVFVGWGAPLVFRNIYCPNCGYKVPPEDATGPRVFYGDRILVLKYLYLLKDPQRWDVVVFKSPADPKYAQNFIKRLVGLPGESLMVLDGDVYKAPPGAAAVAQAFQVQTKPRFVQDALWRVIYDNDYHPRALPRPSDPELRTPTGQWKQPWTPRPDSKGWDLGSDPPNGRVFRFSNDSGGGAIYFDPAANPGQRAFTDWLAYDIDDDSRLRATNPVGDLKLQFFYQRTAGDGPLRLRLTKLGETFTARIAPGQISLRRGDAEQPVGAPVAMSLSSSRPVKIEFMNVDYRVSLWIDGKEILATTPQDYQPDVARLLQAYDQKETAPLPAVEIAAEKQSCALSHISLWRDIYYTNVDARRNPLTWASPYKFPRNIISLGPDEFFVLGDNSLISGDARYWTGNIVLPNEQLNVQSGRVPGRFMLGKALFVYWPAGYPPFSGAPGIVPNFGDMRFIH